MSVSFIYITFVDLLQVLWCSTFLCDLVLIVFSKLRSDATQLTQAQEVYRRILFQKPQKDVIDGRVCMAGDQHRFSHHHK